MNPTTEKVPAAPGQQHVQASGSREGGPPGTGDSNRAARNRSEGNPRERKSLASRLRRDKQMLVMMLPGVLFLLVFFYVPIFGNVIAFQDYQPYLGIGDSLWVGWQNFLDLFINPDFVDAFWNTLYLAAWQLVFLFPVPLVLALIVDSLVSPRIRKIFQSIAYLPHFLSWVLVIAFFQQMLGGAGFINNSLRHMGMDTIPFMTNADTFPVLVVVQMIWKDAGWAMIIFLAALASIDAALYEAAAADGAGRWRRVWHITLPGLRPVIVLLLILRIGDILSVGFEQFILQRDAVGAGAAEVLDTFTYYTGVVGGGWSSGAAAGLAKGVVSLVLIWGANKLAHKFGEDGIFAKKVG